MPSWRSRRIWSKLMSLSLGFGPWLQAEASRASTLRKRKDVHPHRHLSNTVRPELVEGPLFLFAATNKNSASTSPAQTGSRWRCPDLVFNPGLTRATFAAIGAPIPPVPRPLPDSFSRGSFLLFRHHALPTTCPPHNTPEQ